MTLSLSLSLLKHFENISILDLKKKMEKQSNTMQCIPSFFVSLDKIATFVKSV
jgi:hypothetical protein